MEWMRVMFMNYVIIWFLLDGRPFRLGNEYLETLEDTRLFI